jgi:RNA polymerase sigma factor (sigma-70 family)
VTRPALWTKHRPIALAIARDYRIPGLDPDDTRQEALVALWEATGIHDPERGPFPPLARTVIHRHLRDLLQAATRQKRTALIDHDAEPVARDDSAGREQLSLLVDALPTLTELERAAVRAHLNGVPTSSSKRHDNALNRARAKLRAAA